MIILEADKGSFYPLDLLFIAAINRSRSQTGAFINLIKVGNNLSAAPMIRMQVDSILRLSASRLVKNPHDYAQKTLSGEPVRHMKDRDGEYLKDFYLLEKHIFGMVSGENKDGSINICISENQDFIPELTRVEAVEAFYKSVVGLFELCDGWIFTKGKPDLIAKMRDQMTST